MQASTQGDIIHSTVSFMYGLGDVVTGVTCSIHLQRQAVEDVVCHGTKCSWQQQKGHAITNCSVSPSHRIDCPYIACSIHFKFTSRSKLPIAAEQPLLTSAAAAPICAPSSGPSSSDLRQTYLPIMCVVATSSHRTSRQANPFQEVELFHQTQLRHL